jgi:hypothetical protein
MPDNTISLPVATKDQVLFFVTIYDFPKSTLRYQTFVEGYTVEKLTTFDRWIELEAARIARRTKMRFGVVHNNQGQVALAALR